MIQPKILAQQKNAQGSASGSPLAETARQSESAVSLLRAAGLACFQSSQVDGDSDTAAAAANFSVQSESLSHTQVEEGSRKLDLQWEAHTARLKRAVH